VPAGYPPDAVLLLLLAACGNSSYYPQPSLWGLDTGIPDSGDSAEDDVPCPVPTEESVAVHVVMQLPDEVTVYQRTPDCAEQALTTVQSGQQVDLPAYAGAVFVARYDSNSLARWTTVPQGNPDYYWTLQ
jgi:hypothetical protein